MPLFFYNWNKTCMKKILKYDRDERAKRLLFKIDYKLASKYEATIFPLNLNK